MQPLQPHLPLRASRSGPLAGRVRVPGDAALSHFALGLACLARGETRIEGLREDSAVRATSRAIAALGAHVEAEGSVLRISGLGVGGLLEPWGNIDLGSSSGDGLAALLGLVALQDFTTGFVGSGALLEQDFTPLLAALEHAGTRVLEHRNGRLPIAVRGPRTPLPLHMRLPPAQKGIPSALLLAALGVPGTSVFFSPEGQPDALETLLRAFGAEIEHESTDDGTRMIRVAGLPALWAQQVSVPADRSAAALLALSATIVPGSEFVLEDAGESTDVPGALPWLRRMGLDITKEAGSGAAPALRVRHSPLHGVSVPAEDVRHMGDGVAVLAAAAAFAEGETQLEGLSDDALIHALRANGVSCAPSNRCLLIRGGLALGGARIAAGTTPELGFALLAMGLSTEDAVVLEDRAILEEAYPGLLGGLRQLGAAIEDLPQ